MRIEIAKEIRKNVGIMASAKSGQEIRNAISNSLEALATLIEEEEIPIKKMIFSHYLRRVWIVILVLSLSQIIGAYYSLQTYQDFRIQIQRVQDDQVELLKSWNNDLKEIENGLSRIR